MIAIDPRFCPVCGQELSFLYVEQEERDRHVCTACGHIFYVNPKIVAGTIPVADGKVYIINEKGTVFICGTGDEFQLLKTIPMGDAEGTRACIAISNKQLFIRTTQNLYCVGQ